MVFVITENICPRMMHFIKTNSISEQLGLHSAHICDKKTKQTKLGLHKITMDCKPVGRPC